MSPDPHAPAAGLPPAGRTLVWPTALTVAALAVLIGLGTWQLQRKVWKDGLVANISARIDAAPVALEGAVPASDVSRTVLDQIEYLRVRTSGTFQHDRERHLFIAGRDGPGWHILTPLVLADGHRVMVNRGWVPDALRQPDRRPDGQLTGNVEVIGLVRAPEKPGWFTPANNPAANSWYWRDLDAMLADATGNAAGSHYPVFIDAEAKPANPGGWPRGGTTRISLPNRHLEYAVTWYGLAAALFGVYLAFAYGAHRRKAAPDR